MKLYTISFSARCVIEADSEEEAMEIFNTSPVDELCYEIQDEQITNVKEI